MTEQQVVALFDRLYTWNTLATGLDASSIVSEIPDRYGLLKIESNVEGLKFVKILDRHFDIEGGNIISDVGYLNEYEYHLNHEINSSIKVLECEKLSHLVTEEEQDYEVELPTISGSETISIFRTSNGFTRWSKTGSSNTVTPEATNPINNRNIKLKLTWESNGSTKIEDIPITLPENYYQTSNYIYLFDYAQGSWDDYIGKCIKKSSREDLTLVSGSSGRSARAGNLDSMFATEYGDFKSGDEAEVRIWIYQGTRPTNPTVVFNATSSQDYRLTSGRQELPGPLEGEFTYSSSGINFYADKAYIGYNYYVEIELKSRTAPITSNNISKLLTYVDVKINSDKEIQEIALERKDPSIDFSFDLYDPDAQTIGGTTIVKIPVQKLSFNKVDVSDKLTWAVYYTNPFYL